MSDSPGTNGINAPNTTHLPPVTGIPRGPVPTTQAGPIGSSYDIAAAAATSDTISAQTSLISGLGKYIPVSWGVNRYAGLLTFLRVNSANGALVGDLTICAGEIDSVSAVEINNAPMRAGCTYTVYRGVAAQAIDPTVTVALANSSPPGVYTDALNGIAHVVVSLAAASYTADELKGFDVLFRGRKIYDPRDPLQNAQDISTWKYSTNAALIRADFLSSGNALARGVRPAFGRGLKCDYAASIPAFNWCDTLVGTYPNQQKRGEYHGTLLYPQQDSVIDEQMKTASMCNVDQLGDTFTLLPDMPRSAVFFIDANPIGRNNIVKWERVSEKNAAVTPTVIEGSVPDTTQKPWGTKRFRIVHPYVLTGQLPEITESVEYTFARSLGAGTRFATERLNRRRLGLRSWGVSLTPEALSIQKGDVIRATHKIGMTNKDWVADVLLDRGAGDVHVKLSEYDPAFWSNSVATEPTVTGDGSLNCGTYPLITALSASELAGWEPQSGGGYVCAKRVQATWTVGYYPCLAHYQIELSQGGTVIESTTVSSASFVSNPVVAGAYTLRVRQVSTVPGMMADVWSSTTVAISSAACPPNAPEAVWVQGVRSYQESSSPPFGDNELRSINIDAPTSPITSTEIWFGNAAFGTATLAGSIAGYAPSVVFAISTCNVGGFLWWCTYFNGVETQIGGVNSFPRPVMNTKVWVRFVNGALTSVPIEIQLSKPNEPTSSLQLGPGSFKAGSLRAFDGSWYVNAGGAVRNFTSNSNGAAFAPPTGAFSALVGNLTYAHLGGTNQQIDALLIDAFGDPVAGRAMWKASRIYEGI
jgi:hypothetical protein